MESQLIHWTQEPSGRALIDGMMGVRLKALGIDALPYRVFERSRPTEYMSQITDICLNYYLRLGLIKEGDL